MGQNYYSISQYCTLKGITLKPYEKANKGSRASNISTAKGYKIEHVCNHTTKEYYYAYHEDVLNTIFENP
jgi:hypothetical protein